MSSPGPIYDIFDYATKVNSPWALGAFGIAGVVALIWILLSRDEARDALDALRRRVKGPKQSRGEIPIELQSTVDGGQHVPSKDQENTHPRRFEDGGSGPSDFEILPPPFRGVTGPLPSAPAAAAEAASVRRIPWPAWLVLVVAIVVPVGGWTFVATHSDLPYLFRVVVVDKIRGLIPNPHVVCGAPGCNPQGVIDSAAQFQLAPSGLPSDKSVTFYAVDADSNGRKNVTVGKSRSVPVEVDIEPSAAPQPVAIQPQPSQPTPAHASQGPPPTSTSGTPRANPVDAFWLGDYQTEWHQDEGTGDVKDQRWEVIIEQKGRITMTVVRRPTGGANAEYTCDATWTGAATTGNPGTISFEVSREKQVGYFCDVAMPMALTGTIHRIAEQTFVVQSNFAPWKNVGFKLGKPAN